MGGGRAVVALCRRVRKGLPEAQARTELSHGQLGHRPDQIAVTPHPPYSLEQHTPAQPALSSNHPPPPRCPRRAPSRPPPHHSRSQTRRCGGSAAEDGAGGGGMVVGRGGSGQGSRWGGTCMGPREHHRMWCTCTNFSQRAHPLSPGNTLIALLQPLVLTHLPRLIVLVLAHKHVLSQLRRGPRAKLARRQHVLHGEGDGGSGGRVRCMGMLPCLW